MKRIVVIGIIGSGKTTLAAKLSHHLNIPHIEFDAVKWGPNWTPVSPDDIKVHLDEWLCQPCWVADGHHSMARQLVLARADTLIWLDYPLWVVLWQLFGRTLRRYWTRELLWGTNRERGSALFGYPLYAIKKYVAHHSRFPLAFRQPPYQHLHIIRLPSPLAADGWLSRLPPAIEP